jgi:spore germination protein GerM
MRRHGAVLAAGALLGVAVLAAGCAIPTQQSPSTIAPGHVPFGLLSPEPPPTTTTQPRQSSLVEVQVFFLSPDQQLIPESRVVYPPAPLKSIISALLAGPTDRQAANRITTAIPNDVTVLSATSNGLVITVDFNASFGQITGSSTEQAVSQVVATVAAQDGYGTGVDFEIDGQRISVPIASGAQVPGPVYLLQFLGPAR